MALSSYGKTNYEVVVPMTIDYGRTTAITPNVYQPQLDLQYRYTRHVTKTYKFKGMTEATAKACVQAKRAQYTRRFMQWVLYASYYRSPWELHNTTQSWREQPPYTEQVATFNVTRVSDAPVYDLEITINETTALYSRRNYEPTSLSAIPYIENMFVEKTQDPAGHTIVGELWNTQYYHSYAYEYSYDENLLSDTQVAQS